jgi:hypothetical protein
MLTLASQVDGSDQRAAGAPGEPVETWVRPPDRLALLRGWRGDLAAVAMYFFGAFYVTSRLWLDLHNRIQVRNIQDNGFFVFALSNAAHQLFHLHNPLVSTQVNVPYGINMMANTSILGLAIPLAPVTYLFGATVSYAIVLILALALTATTWYFVISQHVVTNRLAAFVAAGFIGFSPGLVSQSNGHPNVAAQFMVPLILLQVARLRQPRRPVRQGLLLAISVIYQAFVNEEILLFTAGIAVVMTIVWWFTGTGDRPRRPGFAGWLRPRQDTNLRKALLALATAVGVTTVAMAYPLCYQFRGPGNYHAVPAKSVSYFSDLASYVTLPSQSVLGHPMLENANRLMSHPVEQNSFFGWPMLLLCLAIAIWLWRLLLVRAAVVVAVVAALFSFGPELMLYGHDTHIPGPYRLVGSMPLLDSVVPVRVALMVAPALGILFALGLDRLLRTSWRSPRPVVMWYALFLVALLPLTPTPLITKTYPPTPAFVADGTWRRYVTPGHTVVPVPLPNIGHLEGERWSASVDLDMALPGGYFLGPPAGGQGRALYGAPDRPTAVLLDNAGRYNVIPDVTDEQRAQAVADLKFWRASVVILGNIANEWAVLETTRQLLGEPQFVGGVWLWDVRSLVDG